MEYEIANFVSENLQYSYWQVLLAGLSYLETRSASRKRNRLASEQLETSLAEQSEQKALLQKQMDAYENLEFKNPYENLENVYEDLTVNQQQAQFEAQQGAQQRADVMQGLRGAAGGSGIAGLAQALANQGQLQSQRISAGIGAQEARKQALAARGAGRVQVAERQGEAMRQQFNIQKQQNLLGMQFGQTTGANYASQQAQRNLDMSRMAGRQQTNRALLGLGTAAMNTDWTQSLGEGLGFGSRMGNTEPLILVDASKQSSAYDYDMPTAGLNLVDPSRQSPIFGQQLTLPQMSAGSYTGMNQGAGLQDYSFGRNISGYGGLDLLGGFYGQQGRKRFDWEY